VAAAAAALMTAGLCLTPSPVAAAAPVAADHVLFSFSGADGAGPLTGVMTGPHGVLYGTTVFGGRHGNGTVFSLTPKGSGYTERVLVSFGGARPVPSTHRCTTSPAAPTAPTRSAP